MVVVVQLLGDSKWVWSRQWFGAGKQWEEGVCGHLAISGCGQCRVVQEVCSGHSGHKVEEWVWSRHVGGVAVACILVGVFTTTCDLPMPALFLACDLIFLGSVDVATAGSDAVLAQTVQQLQSLDLSSMNVVTIAVSREGVTLQENVNGFVRSIELL